MGTCQSSDGSRKCGALCERNEEVFNTAPSMEAVKPRSLRPEQELQAMQQMPPNEPFLQGRLSITVLGASGSLAKVKTFPALLNLFRHNWLPKKVAIFGYGRSPLKTDEFRDMLRPQLAEASRDVLHPDGDQAGVERFLQQVSYLQGQYSNRGNENLRREGDFSRLDAALKAEEAKMDVMDSGVTNRLFYFAIPSEALPDAARSLSQGALSSTGWNRIILEKPFGHDLDSAKRLCDEMLTHCQEEQIYRIDHYLGKEVVQNLLMFRFGNIFLEPIFCREHVSSVSITFKESTGTENEGGAFAQYGIIRDVMQSHLMQVLSLLAMEPPPRLVGQDAADMIRDAKVAVLKSIAPIDPLEVVLGQYTAYDGKPGFLSDSTIQNQSDARNCPTFAMAVLRVRTPRWDGVPFILKAGKAMDARKAEIRVQFKEASGIPMLFAGEAITQNELVMRLQPDEAVYMKVNLKEPGLSHKPITSELDLSYKRRYDSAYRPEAYTRLILEALRGSQEDFVRSDEVISSWKIFSPLLETIEKGPTKKQPMPYRYGSRGPQAADDLAQKVGFRHYDDYDWKPSK